MATDWTHDEPWKIGTRPAFTSSLGFDFYVDDTLTKYLRTVDGKVPKKLSSITCYKIAKDSKWVGYTALKGQTILADDTSLETFGTKLDLLKMMYKRRLL